MKAIKKFFNFIIFLAYTFLLIVFFIATFQGDKINPAGVFVILIWLWIGKIFFKKFLYNKADFVNKASTKSGAILKFQIKQNSKECNIEMIVIPSGTFEMGENGEGIDTPKHKVTLKNKFAMGRYLVTFDEYDMFCNATGRSKPGDHGWGRGRRPVINVSWHDAQAFCKWLSNLKGKKFRLPTEAEWEYACRAGSRTEYFWGDDVSKASKYAWFDANSGNKTHPVGEKQANSFGLHDMSGNVQEWVQDIRNYHYYGAPNDGSAWEATNGYGLGNDSLRVVRGGTYLNDMSCLRSADRMAEDPDESCDACGFRLAMDLA